MIVSAFLEKPQGLNEFTVPQVLLPVFEHAEETARKKGHESGLTSIAFFVIPYLFQHVALLFASEYVQTPDIQDEKLSRLLIGMFYRPGPGKWVEFSRHYAKKIQDSGIQNSCDGLANQFLTLQNWKRTRVSISIMNGNQLKVEKLDLVSFLVSFRNSIAHQKTRTDYGKDFFRDVLNLCRAASTLLHDLNRMDILSGHDDRLFMRIGRTDLKLHPILIVTEMKKPAYLDEYDSARALYSNILSSVLVDSRNLSIMESLEQTLNPLQQSFELETQDICRLTAADWMRRMSLASNDVIQGLISDGQQIGSKMAPLYDREMYLPSQTMKDLFVSFEASASSVLLLSAGQGAGKSAVLLWVADQADSRVKAASLYVNCSVLNSDRTAEGEFEAHLRSTLCLTGDIQKGIVDFWERHQVRTIFYIDAVNEFISTGNTSDDAKRLLGAILGFSAAVHRQNPHAMRVVITGRREFFEDEFTQQMIRSEVRLHETMMFTNDYGGVYQQMEPLNEDEMKSLYQRIQRTRSTHSPLTEWDSISKPVKQLMKNPLRMQLLMYLYSGIDLPEKENEFSLRRKTARAIAMVPGVTDVLSRMVSELRVKPYLDLSEIDGENKLFKDIFVSADDPHAMLPRNVAYQKLVSLGIFREQQISRNGKKHSRSYPYNELIYQIIESNYFTRERRLSKKTHRIINMILVFTILAGILVLLRLDHSISRQVETYADQFGTQSLPVVLTTVVWILSRGSFLVGGILALVLLLYLNAINLLMDGITYIAWLIRTRVAVPDVSAYQRLRSHVFALDKRFIGFSAVLAAAYIGVILVSWIRNGEVLEHEAMNTLAGLVSIISFFYLLFYSYSNYRFCRNSEPGHSARDQLFGRTKRMSLFASLINVVFGFGMFFGLLLFTQLIVIPWAEQVAERRSSFLAYEFIDSVQPHSLSERDQEYLISIADSVNHTSDVVSIAANMILNGTYDREALRKANQIRIPQPVFRAVLLSMALLSAAILAAVCIINPLLELMLKRRALSLHESLYGRKRSTHSL